MFLKQFVISLLTILGLLNANEAAKILGLFTAPARSHNIIHESIMLRLAEMGHEVSWPKEEKKPKNHLSQNNSL